MIRKGLSFIVCLFVLWLAGGFYFLSILPGPVTIQSIAKSDAVVVLTGRAGRIGAGVKLVESGAASQLFISGVHQDVLATDVKELKARLKAKVTLGQEAQNTYENALETQAWALENEVERIILVTDAAHMPRALLMFKATEFPGHITAHPIAHDRLDLLSGDDIRENAPGLITEYSKFLVAQIGAILYRFDERALSF